MGKEAIDGTIHGAIDTVVFDVGNVLIPWQPETLYEKLIDDPAERAWFLREVCSPAWNLEQDRGRTLAAATAERIARFPAYAGLIKAYYERWPEMLGEPIVGSVALLYELRAAGVRLYALTNFSMELFSYTRSRYPFFECFEGIVVSGEEGLIKPDTALYRRLFELYQVTPARSVFIDDSTANVEAARTLGMHVVHFDGADALRESLRALHLPVLIRQALQMDGDS